MEKWTFEKSAAWITPPAPLGLNIRNIKLNLSFNIYDLSSKKELSWNFWRSFRDGFFTFKYATFYTSEIPEIFDKKIFRYELRSDNIFLCYCAESNKQHAK